MNHFTQAELERWRGNGPGSEADRAIAHVAVCADCAQSYAAAILTIVFLAPLLLRHEDETPILRGSGVSAVSPSGEVQGDAIVFEWASGLRADRFRIEVGQGDHVIYTNETTGSKFPASRPL